MNQYDIRKVKVILASGDITDLSTWQRIYSLKQGSDQVGKYFAISTDRKLAQDLPEYGELIICEPLMRWMDAFREEVGEPVHVNSFNRSRAKQLALIKAGYKAALVSPHEKKMAVDIDTRSVGQTRTYARIARTVAKRLNIKIRIGSETYIKNGQTFIHVDVCPEYFGIGEPYEHQSHPIHWENESNW